jgi:hypothetical protein
MSRWTHSICDDCWDNVYEAGRKGQLPSRVADADIERCCFCTNNHKSGIYVRYDPKLLPCQGEHTWGDDQ